MKKILTLLAALLICLCSAAQDRKALQEIVDVFNIDCPMAGGDVVIDEFKIDGDNLIISILTNFDDAGMSVLEILGDDMAKIFIDQFKSDEQTQKLIEVCYDTKTNVVFLISNKAGKRVELNAPWETIAEPVDAIVLTPSSLSQSPVYDYNDLKTLVSLMNANCPEDMGDGDVLESVTLDGEKVVMSFLSNFTDEQLEIVSQMSDQVAHDPDFEELFEVCKAVKCDFVMRFTTPQGKQAEIYVPYTKM